MSLADHARRELEIAGYFDEAGDYNGLIGDSVLELCRVFGGQGHSGYSAEMVRELFYKLSQFQPLADLTNGADEWNEIGVGLWQSNRNSEAFSRDGGHTYYLLSEVMDVYGCPVCTGGFTTAHPWRDEGEVCAEHNRRFVLKRGGGFEENMTHVSARRFR